MNTKKLEQWILLRQSGELSRWKSRRLDAHLAQNPELRQFEADLQLISASNSDTTNTLHAPAIAGSIRAKLLETAEREPAILPAPRWDYLPALAAAAILLIGIGFWTHRAPNDASTIARSPTDISPAQYAWNDDLDQELDEMQDVLASLSEDTTRSTLSATDEESLLRELLKLEGIEI